MRTKDLSGTRALIQVQKEGFAPRLQRKQHASSSATLGGVSKPSLPHNLVFYLSEVCQSNLKEAAWTHIPYTHWGQSLWHGKPPPPAQQKLETMQREPIKIDFPTWVAFGGGVATCDKGLTSHNFRLLYDIARFRTTFNNGHWVAYCRCSAGWLYACIHVLEVCWETWAYMEVGSATCKLGKM